MSDLIPFSFESHDVRVIDRNGDVWLVLKDVLTAIESSTRTADAKNSIIQGLGEEVVINYPNPNSDGVIQNMLLVHESAAYFLLARSRTDKGKDFNRWLFKEVVPAIRKTGKYETPTPTPTPTPKAEAPPPRRLDPAEKMNLVHEMRALAIEEKDDTLRVMLLDVVKNTILPEISGNTEIVPVQSPFFQVHELLEQEFGMTPKEVREWASSVGKKLAREWRKEHDGEDPPTTQRYVDNAVRSVKCYPRGWWDAARDVVIGMIG